MNQDDLRNNLLDSNHWLRIVFMVCFAFAAWVVTILLGVLVLVQLLITLVAGNPNPNLQKSGYQLVRYLEQILQYLLYNTDEKPFPITDFPSAAGFVPPVYARKARPAPQEAAAAGSSAATPPAQAGDTVQPEPQPQPEPEPEPEPDQPNGMDAPTAARSDADDQEKML